VQQIREGECISHWSYPGPPIGQFNNLAGHIEVTKYVDKKKGIEALIIDVFYISVLFIYRPVLQNTSL
jgi:hypothetical protein